MTMHAAASDELSLMPNVPPTRMRVLAHARARRLGQQPARALARLRSRAQADRLQRRMTSGERMKKVCWTLVQKQWRRPELVQESDWKPPKAQADPLLFSPRAHACVPQILYAVCVRLLKQPLVRPSQH